jgi:putative flippase GtrA
VIRVRRAVLNLQTNCALGAVMLARPLAVHLPVASWQAFWFGCRRFRKYAFYGCSLTGVGLMMMYITVSHLSVNVFLAQMVVVPAIMTVLSYFVHRCCTFGDREVCKRSGRRYTIVRLGGMGVSKISFLLLVGVMGVQYLFASMLIVAGLAYPTYKLNRDWAFGEETYSPNEYHKYRGLHGAVPPTFR